MRGALSRLGGRGPRPQRPRGRGVFSAWMSANGWHFCYPYGDADMHVVDAVRTAGYSYGCAIWRGEHTSQHALPRTYVGDADSPWRLWAKAIKHRVTWDYAGRPVQHSASPDPAAPPNA